MWSESELEFPARQVVKIDSRITKVVEMIRDEQYGNLLDIGCSDGRLTTLFASEGVRLFGLETDRGRGAVAKEKNIDVLFESALDNLPAKWNGLSTTGMFDIVFAGEIIEHIEDTDHFLKEILRILSPTGKLIVTTPNIASLENRLRMLVGRYPMWLDYNKSGDNHVRAYTTRALAAQLRENGFQIEDIRGSWVPFVYSTFPGLDKLLRPLSSPMGDWFPEFGMHAVIKASKARRDSH